MYDFLPKGSRQGGAGRGVAWQWLCGDPPLGSPDPPPPVLSGGRCAQGWGQDAHHADELHLGSPVLLSAFPLQVTLPHLGGHMGPDSPHTAFLLGRRVGGRALGRAPLGYSSLATDP